MRRQRKIHIIIIQSQALSHPIDITGRLAFKKQHQRTTTNNQINLFFKIRKQLESAQSINSARSVHEENYRRFNDIEQELPN